ncbi:hypothetical protein J7T55_015496 [Diaporthe amygdali]|uniref:uncharacterized protein n=1 Tax=Phomopsis amygdali TaxID=1214568 RepID=UPI0022FDE890|nr:uncharacterized protein J7T55_015496 [Diaporthe amygdali]KAJ0120763.1 hypothetical protein J7T55_015496 [Diaporthe amygdali]
MPSGRRFVLGFAETLFHSKRFHLAISSRLDVSALEAGLVQSARSIRPKLHYILSYPLFTLLRATTYLASVVIRSSNRYITQSLFAAVCFNSRSDHLAFGPCPLRSPVLSLRTEVLLESEGTPFTSHPSPEALLLDHLFQNLPSQLNLMATRLPVSSIGYSDAKSPVASGRSVMILLSIQLDKEMSGREWSARGKENFWRIVARLDLPPTGKRLFIRDAFTGVNSESPENPETSENNDTAMRVYQEDVRCHRSAHGKRRSTRQTTSLAKSPDDLNSDEDRGPTIDGEQIRAGRAKFGDYRLL